MSFDSAFSSFDNIDPGNSFLKGDSTSPPQDPTSTPPIIVLGSQGSDFLNSYDTILGLSRRYAHLSAFLSLALNALRSDLQSVANRQGHDSASGEPTSIAQIQSEIELLAVLPPFESFSDLKTLVDFHHRNSLVDPVINGVLLCLLQSACVVAVFCVAHDPGPTYVSTTTAVQLRRAWKALSEPCSHLLGFCTGALSAFSLLQLAESDTPLDIWTYARDAIKVVRICFWISLRSSNARLRLAPDSIPAKPSDVWSFTVSVKDPDHIAKVRSHLRRFQELEQQRPLDETAPLVVTAEALNQISIGGPPRQLESFKEFLLQRLGSKCRVMPLKIYSPYHSAVLDREVDLVLLDLERRGLLDDAIFPPTQKLLWETVNADVLREGSLRAALRVIIASNLSATAHWIKAAENLVSHGAAKSATGPPARTVIVSVGPGIGLAVDIQTRLLRSHHRLSSSDAVTVIDVSSLLSDYMLRTDRPDPTISIMPQPDVQGEEIVIVSMACRFPGDVRTPEQLWTCLETGRSTVTEVPKHLFDINAYFGEGINQTMARHMHALPEDVIKSMDARLFSMSPKEIEQLDPQHRLVMLCSYEALERAGYSSEANSPSSFDGKRIAVCMAASWDDYRENASWNIGSYFITGNIRAFIPGHVSFSLKWEGPSVSVDSLECSAVSAIQWSRRALLSGQCDVALAGAVNVLTQPQMFIGMDKEGILSRTGTNATFSSMLDGKTRGDGCGVLLLKRRSTALKDGDTILATLPASRTIYHGRRIGIEEASQHQSQFLARVMSEAGVQASDLVHIEASGYHTQQAEAAEFESFRRLLSQVNGFHVIEPAGRVSVASSRPNIGAGEAVSAMASVIKAVLMFTQGSVPRQVSISHVSELQPKIAAACAKSALFVPIQAQMLPSAKVREGRRLIIVNSLASTESHGVVLVGAPTSDEEAPMYSSASGSASVETKAAWVFVLSAKTRESTDLMKKALINYLQRDLDLADLSYSLACRRTHYPFRLSVVASDQDELIRQLRNADIVEAQARTDLPPLGFVFQTASSSSHESLEASLMSVPGLRDRYDELAPEMHSCDVLHSTQKDLYMIQSCVYTLLYDCGIVPSAIAGKIDPVLLTMFSEHGPELKEALSTTTKSAAVGRHLWVKVQGTVSVSADPSVDQGLSPIADTGALQKSLLTVLGHLHQRGYRVRWIEFFRPHLSALSFLNTLPTYPFQLQQYWMEYHDRNLLQRAKDPVPDLVQTNDYEFPAQPLLTKQIAAEEGSRTYCVELVQEAKLTCFDAWSPLAVIIESMAESIEEASQSFKGVHSVRGTDLLLRNLCFCDAVRHWYRNRNITIAVQRAERMTNGLDGLVHLRSGATHPRIGGCDYVWVEHGFLLKRWSLLQKMVLARIAMIKDEGERFSAKFVCKTLQSERASGSISIRGAHLRKQSSDAVFEICMSHLEPSPSALGRILLASIVSNLEDCARWYAHSMGGDADASPEVVAVEELLVCNHWLEELNQPSNAASDYLVYVSQPSLEADMPEYAAEVSILIIARDKGVVGELSCVRLGTVNYPAGEASSKHASATAFLHADRLKGAPSVVTESTHKGLTPEVVTSQPIECNIAPSMSTGRAMELSNKVLEVLAAELGIAVAEMKPNVRFADLGLDSLMSLVCISTLETLHLGFEIPQSLLLECDNPAELLEWIQQQVGEEGQKHGAPPSIEHQKSVPSAAVQEVPASPLISAPARASQPHTTQDSEVEDLSPPQSSSTVEAAFKKICSTIETELGVAQGSIDSDANLADLGMDSLMSLLVLSNLVGILPIELPSSLFMDHASLREIHAFLAAELGDIRGNVVTVSEVDGQPLASEAASFAVPPAKKPVLLRKGGEVDCDTPLFLLPDGSGMSTVYQNFRGIDRPIYSLNSPYLASASAWTGGMAQIAQHYLESIRLVQPTGPWLVGGWSFGGMVAFEIAHFLATSNSPASDRVAGLFLLDSPCPTMYPPLPMSIVDWIFTAPEVKDIAPPALSDRLTQHFKATVNSLDGWKPLKGGDPNKVPQTWYIVANHPLPGKIEDIQEVNETVRWLFQANRAEKNGADGWQQLLPEEKIVVSPIAEANHFTLVREPAVAKVAHCLQDACRSALLS